MTGCPTSAGFWGTSPDSNAVTMRCSCILDGAGWWLTNPDAGDASTLGYVFNPISVFWCYDGTDVRVAVLAEVHNTYGERHTYRLRPDEQRTSDVDKELYVSPFYPVDGHYEIRVSEPGASVSVTVTLRRDNDAPFVASLRGEQALGKPSQRGEGLPRLTPPFGPPS